MIYDCKERKTIPDRPLDGLTGMISWGRLARILHDAGEVRASEELLFLETTETGIQLRLKHKERA